MEILTVDEDIVHEKEMPKTQTTHTTEDVEISLKNDDILRKTIITNKQKSETEVTKYLKYFKYLIIYSKFLVIYIYRLKKNRICLNYKNM